MSTTIGFYAFATLEMMSEALNKTFGETKGEKLWKKSIKVKDPYSLETAKKRRKSAKPIVIHADYAEEKTILVKYTNPSSAVQIYVISVHHA